jgi:LysM repeat protein
VRSFSRAMLTTALGAGLVGVTAASAAAEETYEVQPGDTLAGIAQQHEVVTSWRALLAANEGAIADPGVIVAGQQLSLPDTADTHEVEPGETLSEIASTYDHVPSWRALADANDIAEPQALAAGQVLTLAADQAPADGSPEPQEPASDPEPTPAPEPEPAPEPSATDTGVWDRLAECESNGDWSANTGNGFYGGLQFTLDSWEAVGGDGYPHEASQQEQIARAEQLQAIQGWDAWPACSDQLGLR